MKHKGIDISQAVMHNVSDEAAKELIDHRENKKVKTTQRAFDRSLKKAVEAGRYGFSPDEAIEETIDAGWVAVTPEFLASRRSRVMSAAAEVSRGRSTRERTLLEDLTDRSFMD